MSKFFPAAILTTAIAVLAACSSADSEPGACEMFAPGTIAAVPGIDVQVRDPYGHAEALGTTAMVKRSTGEAMQVQDIDSLHIYSAYDVTGDFSVAITRPYYRDTTIARVTVTPDGCVVHTTAVPLTLQLVAGAPALRAVAVAGAQYLGEPHAQAQLVAIFDADPSVSRAVTWSVNDTTLATVDANGLLTAKCPTAGGTIKATVTTVATPQVTGSVSISVAPESTCS